MPDEAILAEVAIPLVLGGAEKPDWERDLKPCEKTRADVPSVLSSDWEG
jgi:hypothetical protein